MVYKGKDLTTIPVGLDKGIDGLNNIPDIGSGFLKDARNVDLSSPGLIKKRAGYQVHGCVLPVRTREVDVTFAAGFEQFSVTFDFIPQEEITLEVWLNDATGQARFPDGRYVQQDASTQTLFCRNKDFFSVFGSPASATTITTDTIFEVQAGAQVNYVRPVLVFNSDFFILPIAAIEGGAGANGGAGAATEYTVRVGTGHSFNSVDFLDIDSITRNSTTQYAVTFKSDSTVPFEVGASVFIDIGGTEESGGTYTMPYGYVSDITGQVATIELYNTSTATVDDYYVRIYYSNGQNYIYKSGSLDLYSLNYTSAVEKSIRSCNTFYIADDLQPLSGAGFTSVAQAEVGFFYGTMYEVEKVNMLNFYYDNVEGESKIIAGYSGNLFREEDLSSTVYATQLSSTVLSGVVNKVGGVFVVLVTDASRYELGDKVIYYEVQDIGVFTEIDLTVTAIDTGLSTLSLTHPDSSVSTIEFQPNTILPFKRISRTIKLTTNSDARPFPGMTVQIGNTGKRVAWHKVISTNYDLALTDTITLDSPAEWASSSFIFTGKYFEFIRYPDEVALSQYYPLLQSQFPDTTFDMSSTMLDRELYIAAERDGIWRYNGENTINMYLPAPPTPLLSNLSGTEGTLRIDVDASGNKVGRFYNFILTYSYFQFKNGIIEEIESPVTPFDSVQIQAEPSDNGTLDSSIVEIQVASIPRGVGLPADNILINVYRSTDGTADGGPDSAIFYREASVSNRPDDTVTIIRAGTLTNRLLEENGKELYFTFAGDPATDEFARNKRVAPLPKHIVNFQNRLIALNCRERPYFNFIGQNLYVPGSYNSAFELEIKPYDASLTNYKYIGQNVDNDTTASNSVTFAFDTYTFVTAAIDSASVNAVNRIDESYIFTVSTLTASTSFGERFLLYPLASETVEQYDFPFFDLEFTALNTSTTPDMRTTQKWTKVLPGSIPYTLSDDFFAFKFFDKMSEISTSNGVQFFDNVVEVTFASASAVAAGDYIVIRGIGLQPKLYDRNDSVKKYYDIDTEVVFKIESTGFSTTNFFISPYKIVSGEGTISALQPMNFKCEVTVDNSNISHGPVEFWKYEDDGGGNLLKVSISGVTPASSAFTSIDVVRPYAGSISDFNTGELLGLYNIPNAESPGKLPNSNGVDFNTSFESKGVVIISSTAYTVEIETLTNLNIFSNLTEVVDGRVITKYHFGKTDATTLQILLASTFTAGTTLSAGQWILMTVFNDINQSPNTKLTRYFKVKEFRESVGSTWQTSVTSATTVDGLRVEFYDSLEATDFDGLPNAKILICSDNTSIIPVPLPEEQSNDIYYDTWGVISSSLALDKVIKPLALAINSTAREIGFAYWGANPGSIDEEYPTSGLKFVTHSWFTNRYKYADNRSVDILDTDEFTVTLRGTSGQFKIEGNSDDYESAGLSTDPGELEFVKELYPNRFFYTPPAGFGDLAFRDISFDDIVTDDSQQIVGAIPYEEFMLIFKEDSVWRIRIDEAGIRKERLQTPVGAASKKNIAATDRGAFFIHRTGAYFTDGSTIQKVEQLNRIFRDFVDVNISLLPFTAAHYNPGNHEVYLGLPVGDTEDERVTENKMQAVFNYNYRGISATSIQSGWSISTEVPANYWLRIQDNNYFGGNTGIVYRLRTEAAASKYRDLDQAISMRVDSPYLHFGEPYSDKFIHSYVIEVGADTDQTFDVAEAFDFRKSYTDINTISYDKSVEDATAPGDSYSASVKWAAAFRSNVDPNRCHRISLRFDNGLIDSDGAIHGLYPNVAPLDYKGIRQAEEESC